MPLLIFMIWQRAAISKAVDLATNQNVETKIS
jgi:hypothetical protein